MCNYLIIDIKKYMFIKNFYKNIENIPKIRNLILILMDKKDKMVKENKVIKKIFIINV